MSDVIILGAGMVGVATALALQERGKSVMLIDRGAPGRETSYGNAGLIQAEAVEPYAMPRDLRTLASIALRRSNDVSYHFRSLPSHAGSLLRYFHHSAPWRHRLASLAYSEIVKRATADHQKLILAANADHLLRKEGYHDGFRTVAAFDAATVAATRIRREFGVRSDVLSGAELSRAEPNLKPGLVGAVHWPDAWSCADPGGLVAAYAGLFAARGGTIAVGDATSLIRQSIGWSVKTREGNVSARDVVVALGQWSPFILAQLGYRIRMIRKRGYHRHYQSGAPLRVPLVDVANGAVLSPMRRGLRITTGAELTLADAPATPRQLQRAERGARTLVDLGAPVEQEPWMGVRPCMPDMLPVVGAAPRDDGLWFHFGHGHQGFTLGPTTAELLAASMGGERDAVLEPFSPQRLI